ncbi:MAG: hypothetical protein ACLSTW_05215 [Faecalibacterium sp.]
MPRTIYFLLGGFLLAILFYEAQIWQAIFASAAFFTLVAVVEVLAMLLIGLQVSDTDALMQAGSAGLIYVVFSNLIQIPLLILISHFSVEKKMFFVFFGCCRSSLSKLPVSQFVMWYSTMQRMKIFQTT